MKKSRIALKWYKNKFGKEFNFGDDLSPYLIAKLSDHEVKYVAYAGSRLNITKQFIKGMLNGMCSKIDVLNFIESFFLKKYIISIGSIIQLYSSPRCIVWGSGIISADDKIKKSTFLAVRGVYTKNKILNMGYNSPIVLGDPALLVPLVYKPKNKKKYKLGIIPHIIHFESIIETIKLENLLIIDLGYPNIEKIIEDICSCEYTISTSLHGLIVSHAYNIKSLWFKYNDTPLFGDNVKFLDYFSSVKIPEYNPFNLELNEKFNSSEIIQLIIENANINCINTDIKQIQKELLKTAPFKLKAEYNHTN